MSKKARGRKVTFGVANSLDNFIAREDYSLDWLMWGKEAAEFMADFWTRIDTVLMGRKTYQAALRQMGVAQNPYPRVKSYVLSRTLTSLDDRAVELSSDAFALVRKLKPQRGKEICVMGGGELATSLLQAGLIDEIGFNIHPVLLGSGIPLFHEMKQQIDLRLLECRPFKNGCVLATYGVKH